MTASLLVLLSACRKKETVLKDESIVNERVLVNNEPINQVNESDINASLEIVEGTMTRVVSSIDLMKPDSAKPEIKSLMSKANRGLADARQDLRQVLRKIDKNQIPEAEEKLEDIKSDLSELELELAAEGY